MNDSNLPETSLPEATGVDTPENVPQTTFTDGTDTAGFSVHVPSFWPSVIPEDQEGQKRLQTRLETDYESRDWLPQPLFDEIESCFPSDADIDHENEGQRCPNAFSKRISEFFKVGRTFLNYKQFVAAGQILLDAWAVSSTHAAKSLTCYYSQPLGRKKVEPAPKRKSTASPKQICCPFRIRYSFISKTKDVANIFLNVKVTFVETGHNHPLGIPEHRVAKAKSGNCKPNPKAWAFFLQAFRQNPQMDANTIRCLLKEAYPSYKSFTAKAISNIRRSAHLALNDPKCASNMDQLKYKPHGMVAADEPSRAENNNLPTTNDDTSITNGPATYGKDLTADSLMLRCQQLCELIQNDQKRIEQACIMVETMIQRSHDGLDLVATFGSEGESITTGDPTAGHRKRMKLSFTHGSV